MCGVRRVNSHLCDSGESQLDKKFVTWRRESASSNTLDVD